MPVYTFAIESGGRPKDDIRWTNLPDRGWARKHACLIIQELKQRPEYRDPELKMVVKDGDGEVIDIIPF